MIYNYLLHAAQDLRTVTMVNPSQARTELGHLIRLWEIHWHESPN